MSLINDALKKAQKQQDPQSVDTAAAPGAPVTAHAGLRRGKSVGIEKMLLGVVALVVVLVGVTVIGVLMFKKERPIPVAAAPRAPVAPVTPPPAPQPAPEPAPEPIAASPAAPAPSGAAASVEPSAAVPPAASVSPESAPATPVVVAPAASPAPAVPSPPAEQVPTAIAHRPSPAPSVAAAPAVASPPPAAPPPAASSPTVQIDLTAPPAATPAAPMPAPARVAPAVPVAPAVAVDILYRRRVIAFIDGLRVTGVRAAGDDSKVLMNDRVYHLNDAVDLDLGVKLTGVSTTVLMFTDDTGRVYTKALQ